MTKSPYSPNAFSLVEVVFAIFIVSFCLLSVLALMPIGVTTTHDSLENTSAAGIASAIAADIHSTAITSSTTGTTSPRYSVSLGANAVQTVLYFSGDDNFTVTTPSTANPPIYRATITPGTLTTAGTQQVRIWITWPALADSTGTKNPQNFTGSIDVMTALNTNSP
jgi:uncharacterized protein (TIGR02598 family)